MNIKWYYRDGSLAVDMSDPQWKTHMSKLNEKLDDMKYRVVAQNLLWWGGKVSTIWLGLDHSFSDMESTSHRPLIFETMVFSRLHYRDFRNYHDLDMMRYSSEAEALAGHRALVRLWNNPLYILSYWLEDTWWRLCLKYQNYRLRGKAKGLT